MGVVSSRRGLCCTWHMLHVAMATFNEEEKKKFEEAVSVLVSFSERAHGVQESVSEPGCSGQSSAEPQSNGILKLL